MELTCDREADGNSAGLSRTIGCKLKSMNTAVRAVRKMSAKEAHEIAFKIRAIYEATEGDLRLAIPELAQIEIIRGFDRAEAYSRAKFYFQTWSALSRMTLEQLTKLDRDLPARTRRDQFKLIHGGKSACGASRSLRARARGGDVCGSEQSFARARQRCHR
jgi:hypothetical protein